MGLFRRPIMGPNPTDYTVNKASIATLLCPSDGVVNTCSGYAQYINYQPGNFNYVANTGHPRNVLLPGDPPNTRHPPAADRHHLDVEDVPGPGCAAQRMHESQRQRERHPGEHHRRDVQYGRGQRIARQRRLGQ